MEDQQDPGGEEKLSATEEVSQSKDENTLIRILRDYHTPVVAWLSFFGVVVSLIYTCDSNKRAEDAYWDSLSINLYCYVRPDGSTIQFSSANSEHLISGIAVYFPPQLDTIVWNASPQFWEIHTTLISLEVRDFVDSILEIEEGTIQVMDDFRIPSVVEITYTTGRKTIEIKYLYKFSFTIVMRDDNTTSVKLVGVTRMGPLKNSIHSHSFLKDEWEKAVIEEWPPVAK